MVGTRPVMAYGNETYKLNLKDWHDTMNLIGSSFGMCLRNRLLSCTLRFTARSFGCTLRRARIESCSDGFLL
jgi:hypothetical protein